jgi:hypothetical protein
VAELAGNELAPPAVVVYSEDAIVGRSLLLALDDSVLVGAAKDNHVYMFC